MKILFIVPHRLGRSPGQRFRCEQYLHYLREHGYSIVYSNILNEWDDYYFYKKGSYLLKLYILLKSFFIRCYDIVRSFNSDYVFIYREALMVGTTFFEKLYAMGNAKIIFDFDDSIWLNDTSVGNKSLSWMKRPQKTSEICKVSDIVVVGNSYLMEYAKCFCSNVVIIPTTIDTSYHSRKENQKEHNSVCIGWTGTSTTLKHFELLVPALIKLKNTFADKITIKVICNEFFSHPDLQIESVLWSLSKEIDDLSSIDIGVMPLPDDEWSKGKCGFKGLQYMSLSIPAVMSPVGVNCDIIAHGENGFLASTEDEWIDIVSKLIIDSDLRKRVGECGRQTIVEKYSVEANKNSFLSLFSKN